MLTESSSGSLTLVLSRLPSDLNFAHSGSTELPKNHQYFLPSGSLLQIQVRGSFTAPFCPEHKVFMKFEKVTITDLKVVIDILDYYNTNETSLSRAVTEYTLEDFKNGIVCENERTMQRILKKTLAKKRLKFLIIIIKFICICRRYKFLEKYYAPNGRGYLLAQLEYQSLCLVQKQTDNCPTW